MSGCEAGQGYPVERALPQQQNAAILNDVKQAVEAVKIVKQVE